MNSTERVLKGFEWAYTGTVSIMRGSGYQGKGVSRTLFLAPKLEDVPEQLFALKISQSTNPAKAGKPVFKFFSYRFDENAKFENTAPEAVNMQTPLSDIKAMVISKFGNIPTAQISLNINLPGRFTNVTCADGTYAIYDEEKFPNEDPNKVGEAPYYIKGDAVINVTLKGAESQNNEYLQTTLSTTAVSNDIFQKTQSGKVWDGENSQPQDPAAGGSTKPVW